MGAIGNDLIYVNKTDASQQDLDYRLAQLSTTLEKAEEDCPDIIFTLMCHNSFPLCDRNSTTPVPRMVSDVKVYMQLIYLFV